METVTYQAAGGVVVRGDEVLLLYKRTRGEVMLPKGHIEPGETPEAAALRETREETGYANLRLLANLGTLPAEFALDGRRVRRDETYFLMDLVDGTREPAAAHDDAEHDSLIFEPLWTPLAEAPERLTFEPARTFMRRALEWLRTHRPAAESPSR